MNIKDLTQRASPPIPWAEGDNIPWNEPDFSRRMLKEHLSQSHDAASRRFTIIDQHVSWIHNHLLAGQPTRILDLCCGPGLYTSRLARLGHTCYGLDYSPASIEYAISSASQEQLNCTYTCQDIRQGEFEGGVGLVMMLYGEFNVFRPAHADLILGKVWQALEPGGMLLLEPHPFEVVKRLGEAPASWYSSKSGLFSESPHLVLHENFWDERTSTATMRYYVVDGGSGEVIPYAQSMQAYQDEEYRSLLGTKGFGEIRILPGLLDEASPQELMAIMARKM